MKIMDKETMEPIYDQRVNDTLAGLLSGETREALAESFNLANWKSLDIYMRRKGFIWDSHNQTYIPAITRIDTILELLIQNKDRLLSLLMPESTGTIPRYAVSGTPKTQSLYMSDLLARILKEFSESQNLKQWEVVEGALSEYFKRWGLN
ncbi:hypothetical protein LNN31_04295 [Acetobacterium wieringae]|uniref:Uncharacterized protein n=1 Tax=Acetobacterium wieringae TaxID=52694 RepID=A0ABY6HGJ4_9FIRM|nr:hypothetical protein [Acetobacterium wieringae]MEA4806859.1 hypothetical protein [Acetobacterium wieringae]UYO63657.1 hypothetical protein LNN31_04295 [Acetobacterium wieringae]VUZ25684.1 Uncharacterised protein [Acetobacterium wieringae]